VEIASHWGAEWESGEREGGERRNRTTKKGRKGEKKEKQETYYNPHWSTPSYPSSKQLPTP